MKTNFFSGGVAILLLLQTGCAQEKAAEENLQVVIDKQASEGIWYGEDSLSYGIIGVEEGEFNFINGRLSSGYINLNPQKIDTLQYQNNQSVARKTIPSKFKIERVEEAADEKEGTTHTLVGRFEYDDTSVSEKEVRMPVVMNYNHNQLIMTSKSADRASGTSNLAFHIIADVDNQELVQQQVSQKMRPRNIELPVKVQVRQDSLMKIRKRIPTKIVLQLNMKKRVYQQGDTVPVSIGLYNDNNEYAGAPKALEIQLFNSRKKGDPLETVHFDRGQSLRETTIVLQEEGVLELLAVHPELYSGSLFIKVMPRYGMFVPKPRSFRVWLANYQPDNNVYIEAYSQSRSFKANGKDSAEVSFFLFDREGWYPEGVRLNIIPSYGRVYPPQLVVKGDEPGIVKLVSKDQEDVTLQVVANPDIEVVNDVKVKFVPPVTYIQCVSSPPSINFLEKSKILVRLLDEDSAALTVKTPWEVSLEISQGGGEISPQLITIQPNKFEDKAEFAPKSFIGTAKVRAVSSNLYANNNTITVTWPVLIIIASIVGGLVGGFISYFHEGDKAKKWKIFTGFFTGMVLYWAIIVFGIVDFAPDILLNVFSVFIISLIGGYLGVGSINFVLKKFGLSKV
ncbi:hypothetical protein C900_03843 [Fulvivirga imtechensis AK7]|uniref:Uncharacterized protein n=1 Tax=Fulvivirga imtechensis AK7 TaxID=1237149 RepID=L8JPM5_9BACT|nr:TIGR04086 family membrane protein [Fulvivirga imtechensis]ELR70158.1 hypothetical protein C900_03843 [Fulvivirga imtechensis AK7]